VRTALSSDMLTGEWALAGVFSDMSVSPTENHLTNPISSPNTASLNILGGAGRWLRRAGGLNEVALLRKFPLWSCW